MNHSEFETNIRLIYGEKGEQWFASLPSLMAHMVALWNLRELIPYPGLTYNYVAKGWQGERPIALKLSIDDLTFQHEYAALRAFKGYGVIPLLDVNVSERALLLHQAVPGSTLLSLFPTKDERALDIACRQAKRLHQAPIPNNYSFPFLSHQLKILDAPWDLPSLQLNVARQLKEELLGDPTPLVLLHGDFHYNNVLLDGDKWIVIDPKGVVGHPLYDMAGCLLREPFDVLMKQPDVPGLLRTRLQIVSHATASPLQKVWAWLYVQTVQSICWSLEDRQDVTLKREFLEILEQSQYRK